MMKKIKKTTKKIADTVRLADTNKIGNYRITDKIWLLLKYRSVKICLQLNYGCGNEGKNQRESDACGADHRDRLFRRGLSDRWDLFYAGSAGVCSQSLGGDCSGGGHGGSYESYDP